MEHVDGAADVTTRITKPSSDDATNSSERNSSIGGIMFMQAFAAGSIASSCCLIQLGMNVLSYWNIIHIGCAGFNKTLGPLRPYTRTMTIAWLLWNWMTFNARLEECCSTSSYSSQNKKKRNRLKRRLLHSTLICLFLMFMPEMLEYGRDIITTQKLQSLAASSSSSGKSGADVQQRSLVKLEYVVDNMGCEACVSAVEGIVSRHDNVAMGKVTSFDLGTLDLYVYEDVNAGKVTGTSSSMSDSDRGATSSRRRLEREINDLLEQDGYELHEKGWITKRMKMEDGGKVKNVGASFIS